MKFRTLDDKLEININLSEWELLGYLKTKQLFVWSVGEKYIVGKVTSVQLTDENITTLIILLTPENRGELDLLFPHRGELYFVSV